MQQIIRYYLLTYVSENATVRKTPKSNKINMVHITKHRFFSTKPEGHEFTEGILAFTVNAKKPEELTSQTLHAKRTVVPHSTGTVEVMIENSLYEKVRQSHTGISYQGENTLKEVIITEKFIGKKRKLENA